MKWRVECVAASNLTARKLSCKQKRKFGQQNFRHKKPITFPANIKKKNSFYDSQYEDKRKLQNILSHLFCSNKNMWSKKFLERLSGPRSFRSVIIQKILHKKEKLYLSNCIIVLNDVFHKKWYEIILITNDRLLTCGLYYLFSSRKFLMFVIYAISEINLRFSW